MIFMLKFEIQSLARNMILMNKEKGEGAQVKREESFPTGFGLALPTYGTCMAAHD